jgi:S-adenosylmethionine:tRNA ribosyltransferase-isomerase
LKKLEIKGIKFAEVTLTRWFGDIQSCWGWRLSKHKMDSEELKITQAACDVNDAKEKK